MIELKAAAKRFRGFLPVVVDVETGGIEPSTDAILELSAVPLTLTETGDWGLAPDLSLYHYHIQPFEGARLDPEALAFNKIIPNHPFNNALPESDMLTDLFAKIKPMLKAHNCQKAILVGHNAWFDLAFLNAACKRTGIKSIFHRFSSFDTATLGGLAYGQTVLAKAAMAAKLPFNVGEAHSALYDATITAELFCKIVNTWDGIQKNIRG